MQCIITEFMSKGIKYLKEQADVLSVVKDDLFKWLDSKVFYYNVVQFTALEKCILHLEFHFVICIRLEANN